jgi:hypothetical protein
VTTSTISQTESVSSVGPQVKLTLNWSYRETTKDKSSGATLVDITEDRTMVGSINICPDGQGAVGAFVDVKDKFTGFANGVTTTLTASSGTVFTGYVGDNASLQNVHETVQDRQSWESASGSGSYESTISATSNADASGSTSGGLDGNSFQGAFTASDAAAAVRGATAAAWTFVLSGHSLAEAYQSAQRLWRNGRCVMVQAPDYGAETPIAVADQQKSQNDEAVDPSSETKFAASLKHRFEGAAPSAPLTAVLTSGAKSLAPNRIDGGSGSLTYKAPDEDGKKATATLQSTSKRGIGTLVLDFHTGGALTLTLTGTATSHLAFIGNTSDQSVQVTIGPIDFKKLTPDIYSASGTWRSTIHSLTANSLGTNTCDGTENGTIDMEAQVETRAGQKVWVITPISMASADGSGSQTCVNSLGGTTLRGVTLPRTVTSDSDGGSATLFLSALDDIVIPSAGGRIPVRGTRNIGGTTTISAQGTATATTKK